MEHVHLEPVPGLWQKKWPWSLRQWSNWCASRRIPVCKELLYLSPKPRYHSLLYIVIRLERMASEGFL